MPNPRRILLLALLLFTAACGSSAGEESGPAPRRSPSVISSEELARTTWNNAYDIVQNLRPNWLRRRAGLGASNELLVYMDETRLGGVSVLRNIEKPSIQELRYVDPNAATNRWGLGHSAGAIQIIRKR